MAATLEQFVCGWPQDIHYYNFLGLIHLNKVRLVLILGPRPLKIPVMLPYF